MEKDMAVNLKGKTIFDLCDDRDVIREIIGGDFSEDYYKECPKTVIYNHIGVYALRINDDDLYDSAVKMFKEAEKEWDKRCEEAMKRGVIID